MLNPTLSDLIGGIQSVTLGDEEARRRRTQKSVLERKAPPTFDVVVEIQSRDRVMVHADVAQTVDALLRGDPIAPELRWRDEGGVHRTQARPRPGPQSQMPGERFGGLVGSGSGLGPGGSWRVEPGWRPDGGRTEPERGYRPGYRPGASGGWRRDARRSSSTEGGTSRPFAGEPGEAEPWAAPGGAFLSGDIADRGPVERSLAPLEARARDARELDRQRAWRESAARALATVNEDGAERLDGDAADESMDEFITEEELTGDRRPTPLPEPGSNVLQELRVLGFGIGRKKLEQAVRELQLPVTVVREADEADAVITLRNYFRQKTPALREAEERGLPIFVLKANTLMQMESALTSIFALEVDPSDAALREVEEAIGLVQREAKPVELSPQNAYIRRLQHQRAEAANLVTRSRGREPFRRVRVYPDPVREWR